MDMRKSLGNVVLETSMDISPKSSSPLRRKSVILQKKAPLNLIENDDDAERLARRLEMHNTIISSTPLSSLITSDKRRSLGLSFLAKVPEPQITERISQCIKLSAENKINIKNAFSLEIIDFMTYMVKRQDSNVSNLQVASTSLDVSTKIYGYRVDGVHTMILKMVGALDKKQTSEEDAVEGANEQDENNIVNENDENHVKRRVQKKKKRNKHNIFSTVESLKGNIETVLPQSVMIGDGDTQTSDTLCQVCLPNHANSGFYLHPYNDVILDTLEENPKEQTNVVEYTIPKIEDISQLEICSSFTDFKFRGWNIDNEPELLSEEKEKTRFQFDLDASLPPNDGFHNSISYFDIEDQCDNVNQCAKNVNNVENIVDLRQVLTVPGTTKSSEYSFIKNDLNLHWAGPSHWKIRNFSKSLGNVNEMRMCHQASTKKKKKEIVLHYDDAIKEATKEKFIQSESVKLHAKTARLDWNTNKVTLPEDMHYDISRLSKLYFLPGVIIRSKRKGSETVELPSDSDNYDYNNENDISNYCPNINDEDNGQEQRDDNCGNDVEYRFDDDGAVGTQTALVGDNLVIAPKLVSKNFVQYSQRAKKIDMRQLKRAIWKSLNASDNNNKNDNIKDVNDSSKTEVENIEETIIKAKNFSTIYKELSNNLSKVNMEALSGPIAFVSLLHLVNEKTLTLDSIEDFSDVIVKKD